MCAKKHITYQTLVYLQYVEKKAKSEVHAYFNSHYLSLYNTYNFNSCNKYIWTWTGIFKKLFHYPKAYGNWPTCNYLFDLK